MNLRTRFALLFSLFVFIILLVSVTSIYFLYEKFRREEFYERVKDKAVRYGAYFFDRVVAETADTSRAGKPNLTLTSEKVVVLNENKEVLFAQPDTTGLQIPPATYDNARKHKFSYITHGYVESVVYHVDNKGRGGFIISSAYDKFGRRKIDNLRLIMIATLGGGLLLSGLFAFVYVKQIVKPLGLLTEQMQRIADNNLEDRLAIRKNDVELTRIARNFNQMLDKLENAFEMRKRFVQHASHELRTPLTSMLAQTEAAIEKELTAEESNAIFRSLREDQQHLIELTNSLLLLSKYEKLPLLTDMAVVRVDETLYEAIDTVKLLYPDCHITVNYTSMPENENLLNVLGNDVLLMSALQNLVKNACHYSDDNQVVINIDAQPNGMTLTFDNTGKQLSDEEKQWLFIPFFRGENSKHKKGYGLGLSIVQRIINLHKGTINYMAINGTLNRFSVSFPRVKA